MKTEFQKRFEERYGEGVEIPWSKAQLQIMDDKGRLAEQILKMMEEIENE